ncbi:MAG: vitamin K epoxide reductase family protein [Gemmatimonadetes bacterium]|nr:vitamin K epoxide reductase family protein [Gemmatimonadota bacterium]
MIRRQAIAVLSLIAGVVALYLHLYKLGLVGSISCDTGGCDRAMFSSWGWFVGVDVALVGVVGYALLLIASIVSLQPALAGRRWPVTTLLVLAVLGFTFTLRLKYGEFIVLRTFCPWCAISAVAITIIWILAILEFRAVTARLEGKAAPR